MLGILFLGVAILNLVASVRIITKAGYSGWWILAPFAPVVMIIITTAVGTHALVSGITRGSFDFAPTGSLAVILLLSVIFSEVVFLIFAFAEWPALRQQRERVLVSSGARAQAELPAAPVRGQDPGWYQIGATNNEQGYWDGEGWTARRRWDGAGWTEEQPRQSNRDPEP